MKDPPGGSSLILSKNDIFSTTKVPALAVQPRID
jgi:hypothetical protein